MKTYVVALAVGLLVGAIYGLLNVRSPAPPVVALVGLLGILVGEQLVPIAREALAGRSVTAHLDLHAKPHLFGPLPGGGRSAPTASAPAEPAPGQRTST